MQLITGEGKRQAAVLALILATAILAGCATGGKSRPPISAPATEGLRVERLEEGREGFVIVETPRMSPESRSDFERAVALLKAEEYLRAAELLEKLIESSPGVTAPYINAAIAYRHLENPERAEAHLKEALKLIPQHPAANNEYGLMLRKTGRFAEARDVYEKTLETFPDYYPVRRNLGILCDLYLSDPQCALEQYEIYSEAVPDDERVRMWVADLRMRLGL